MKKEIDGKTIKNCILLQSISTIKSLEKGNFSKYKFIKEIQLNENIEKIPMGCFDKCLSLSTITIPTNCSIIETSSFRRCISLSSIVIPSSVKKIEEGAFFGCYSLKRIEIKNPEIEIGYDAFGKCTTLEEIIIENERITEYPFEVNYRQMKEFETIGIICNNIVLTKDDIVTYGNEIRYDSRIHRIDDYCFLWNEELTEYTIPTNVTELGIFSFSHCFNLTSISIPSSVTEIYPYCFEVENTNCLSSRCLSSKI